MASKIDEESCVTSDSVSKVVDLTVGVKRVDTGATITLVKRVVHGGIDRGDTTTLVHSPDSSTTEGETKNDTDDDTDNGSSTERGSDGDGLSHTSVASEIAHGTERVRGAVLTILIDEVLVVTVVSGVLTGSTGTVLSARGIAETDTALFVRGTFDGAVLAALERSADVESARIVIKARNVGVDAANIRLAGIDGAHVVVIAVLGDVDRDVDAAINRA